MKKGSKTLLIIGVLVLILVGGTLTTYNGLIAKDEAVATAWGNVQSQYQRRADLIPNLVNVVKGYAKHESETLEGVIAARAKATQISVDANNLSPEKLKEFQAAQGELSQAFKGASAKRTANASTARSATSAAKTTEDNRT